MELTNRYTGWYRDDHAGRYITLDISDWTYSEWWLLQMRHYLDYYFDLYWDLHLGVKGDAIPPGSDHRRELQHRPRIPRPEGADRV